MHLEILFKRIISKNSRDARRVIFLFKCCKNKIDNCARSDNLRNGLKVVSPRERREDSVKQTNIHVYIYPRSETRSPRIAWATVTLAQSARVVPARASNPACVSFIDTSTFGLPRLPSDRARARARGESAVLVALSLTRAVGMSATAVRDDANEDVVRGTIIGYSTARDPLSGTATTIVITETQKVDRRNQRLVKGSSLCSAERLLYRASSLANIRR